MTREQNTPETQGGAPNSRRPGTICVDLDGTLVRTDTLLEGLVRLLHSPRSWVGLLGASLRGRATLKRQVADRVALDVERLPYERTLIEYLRAEREHGRRLVLATAADQRVADAVCEYLNLFDEVIASDGVNNVKGLAKSKVLVKRFGLREFTYVGNSWTDFEVWRDAGGAVLVNAPRGLAEKVAGITPIERRIDDRPSSVRNLIRVLRPYQWLKNVLVFLPLITANALRDWGAWVESVLMFWAFCATASAVYIINDIMDLKADRAHPRKRGRPFASGDLPLVAAPIAAPALLLAGILFGLAADSVRVIVVYAACSFVYSMKIKELPLVDVFALALLYTLRVVGGAEASDYQLSPWLLAFSIFLFLGLAVMKRVSELVDLSRRETRTAPRRGYDTDDMLVLRTMGVSASFMSATVLALFVQSDSVIQRYANPQLLWAVVPLLLFWQCRLWLSTARGYMHDDPIVYAARDWVSWVTGGTVLVAFVLARGLDSRVG